MAAVTPFIIPVFLPHLGCPHRCVFCNQRAITGKEPVFPEPASLIEQGLRSSRRKERPVQVAFYGGNFAGLSMERKNRLLDACRPYLARGDVHSIRISTRPDSVDKATIDHLKSNGVDTVELGVQSLDDRVLRINRRGHTSRQVERAVHDLRRAGMRVGVQLMIGLPGDSRETALRTARRTVRLAPSMVRIYPTLVLRDSGLARWYAAGRYRPLSLPQAVEICAAMLDILEEAGIPVIRMGLQDTPSLQEKGEILAGPHHPAFGQLVQSARWKAKAAALLDRYPPPRRGRFRIHPSQISNLVGQRRSNLEELRSRWFLEEVAVVPDSTLDRRTLRFEPN